MTPTPLNPARLDRVLRRLTLVVASIIKLAGVFLAIKAATSNPPDAVELMVAAFMASGAQFSEQVAMKMLNSFLGREPTKKPEHHE